MIRRPPRSTLFPYTTLFRSQGPRIRVGELAGSRVLRPGEVVVFAPQELATGGEIPTTYADLARDARPGARILLNDGLLAVEVTEIAPPRVRALVVDGGPLTSHKGMNLPGLQVSAPALTEKDCRSEEHTSELQSQSNLVCRLLLEKKKNTRKNFKYTT